MSYTEKLNDDDKNSKQEKFLQKNLKERRSGKVNANHEKRYEVLKNGVRIFTSDRRHDALSYIIKFCGGTFKQAMESGEWGLKVDGELFQGSDGKQSAKPDGIKVPL